MIRDGLVWLVLAVAVPMVILGRPPVLARHFREPLRLAFVLGAGLNVVAIFLAWP